LGHLRSNGIINPPAHYVEPGAEAAPTVLYSTRFNFSHDTGLRLRQKGDEGKPIEAYEIGAADEPLRQTFQSTEFDFGWSVLILVSGKKPRPSGDSGGPKLLRHDPSREENLGIMAFARELLLAKRMIRDLEGSPLGG
jgi:hypothetical protein